MKASIIPIKRYQKGGKEITLKRTHIEPWGDFSSDYRENND